MFAAFSACVFLATCLLYYHWKRRRLYFLASKFRGPATYPLIGNANLFIHFKDIVQNTLVMLNDYGLTFKVWIFNVLLVMISEPKHNKIVLNSPYCMEKEKRYEVAKDAFGNGLLAAPAEIWKTHRKIINPTFNQKILDSFVPIFVEQSEILVEVLEKEAKNGQIFDVHEYLSSCSLDFICETAMGIKVNAQKDPSHFLLCTRRAAQLMIERVFRVWLHPNWIFNCTKRGQEFRKCLHDSHLYIDKIIKKRWNEVQNDKLNENENKDDNVRRPFLEHLMKLGCDLSLTDIRDEVAVFITAGSDTVSTTTGYTLVCLGMHKHIQQKVVEEIDEIFGNSDRPITLEDLPKMVYLERVIKETMRLYPPVPFVARSVTKEVDLGDYVLPKDCAVVVCIMGTHRNPDFWPDPLKFDPDRFLPENSSKRHPYSFIPFSAGPRNCIGIRYAMLALKVLLVGILRSYKVDTNLKHEDIKLSVEIVSKMIGGTNIKLTKRYD